MNKSVMPDINSGTAECLNIRKYVVLGSGIAGFTAASEIRALDPAALITMITGEDTLPYLRPLLSKTWFRSFKNEAALLACEDWFAQNKITVLKNTCIDRILPEEKLVLLTSGAKISYDRCIYALGADSFVPPIKGCNLPGVMTVRTTEDFRKIRLALTAAGKAIVIGGGVVGLEIAWELSKMDMSVTILEAADRLMGRLLDHQSAEVLTRQIRACGIACESNVSITEILGEDTACGVKLADGRIFETDLIILSCGIRPAVSVAQRSGIPCVRGILVNQFLQTETPDMYAAGDCIQGDFPNPGLWNFAKHSALTAAHNAVFPNTPKSFLPNQEPVILSAFDTGLFVIGNIEEGDNVTCRVLYSQPDASVFRINPMNNTGTGYKKLFYRNGLLCGAVLLGDLSDMQTLKNALSLPANDQ